MIDLTYEELTELTNYLEGREYGILTVAEAYSKLNKARAERKAYHDKISEGADYVAILPE